MPPNMFHSNKITLDTYTQSEAALADAVSKKHGQNTDTGTSNIFKFEKATKFATVAPTLAGGVLSVDCSLGNKQLYSASGTTCTNIDFINMPAVAGDAIGITLCIYGNGGTVTMPAGASNYKIAGATGKILGGTTPITAVENGKMTIIALTYFQSIDKAILSVEENKGALA